MNTVSYPFTCRPQSEALYAALADDAFYLAMQNSVNGNRRRQREAMLRYYDYAIQEGHRYGQVHFPPDQTVGASIWSTPLDGHLAARRTKEKKAFLRRWMGEASQDTYRDITDDMYRQTTTVVPPGSWYLSIVGVAPACQGKGLGSLLIRPTLAQTDNLGVCTYLETFTPRNMSFYQRMGYRKAGVFHAPGARARYWVMIRRPSPAAITERTA